MQSVQQRSEESLSGSGTAGVFAAALRHHQAGRLTDAELLCREILAVDPDHADSLHMIGVIAHQMGGHEAAIDMIGRAIACNAGEACYHSNLGVALRALGQLDEAVACYRRALDLKPDFPEGHSNLGHILQQMGRQDEAIACYLTALDLKPDFPEAHKQLGNVRVQQGRLDEALACYRRALDLEPDFLEALYNLGHTLLQLGLPDEAVVYLRRALMLKSDYPDALNELGNALQQLQRSGEAIVCFRAALDLQPNYPEVHSNLGVAHMAEGRLREAAAWYRSALDLKADYPDAHLNLAMALLATGDMAAGWEEYEWRWKTPRMIKNRRDFTQPQWRGEAAPGRRLLIHAEQGFGDTVQFCRYVPLAAAKGLRVILEVPRPLYRLLRGLKGVDLMVCQGEELPPFDLHCPMLSLPLAMGTTIPTIPNDACYLRADELQAEAWQLRLDAMPESGLRVGLVWAGKADCVFDRRRSLAPDRLAPLFDVSGVRFFSLQKGGQAGPEVFPLIDFMDEMADFADTAALVANLDLVISVDTAVAHLAAAMGKPVWLLDRFDPDWRWLVGRRDSPWYPSVRIYRQPQPGDWEAVLAEIAYDLRAFISCSRRRPGSISKLAATEAGRFFVGNPHS